MGESVQKLYRCMRKQGLSHPAVKCYDAKSVQLTKSIPIAIIGCMTSFSLCCLRHTLLMLQVSVHISMYAGKCLIRAKGSLLEANVPRSSRKAGRNQLHNLQLLRVAAVEHLNDKRACVYLYFSKILCSSYYRCFYDVVYATFGQCLKSWMSTWLTFLSTFLARRN